MTVIAEKDRPTVRDLLARELREDVELLLFTPGRSHAVGHAASARDDGLTSDETQELLEELAGLSDRLHLTTIDLGADPAASTQFNVTAVPTVIIRRRDFATSAAGPSESVAEQPAQSAGSDAASRQDQGFGHGDNVRFLGLPGGYEFSTLLADLIDVSKGQSGLSEAGRAAVEAIDQPVHIQVFVTPT
jgi:alkyl hydroperoxide reductase subunit AhpF